MNNSNYKSQLLLIKYHDLFHNFCPKGNELIPVDNSCQICNPQPAPEELSIAFLTFWNWYKIAQPAKSYSGKTVEFFNHFGHQLLAEKLDPTIIIIIVSNLLLSIRYNTASTRPIEQLKHIIIDLAHHSKVFTTALSKDPKSPLSPQAEDIPITPVTIGSSASAIYQSQFQQPPQQPDTPLINLRDSFEEDSDWEAQLYTNPTTSIYTTGIDEEEGFGDSSAYRHYKQVEQENYFIAPEQSSQSPEKTLTTKTKLITFGEDQSSSVASSPGYGRIIQDSNDQDLEKTINAPPIQKEPSLPTYQPKSKQKQKQIEQPSNWIESDPWKQSILFSPPSSPPKKFYSKPTSKPFRPVKPKILQVPNIPITTSNISTQPTQLPAPIMNPWQFPGSAFNNPTGFNLGGTSQPSGSQQSGSGFGFNAGIGTNNNTNHGMSSQEFQNVMAQVTNAFQQIIQTIPQGGGDGSDDNQDLNLIKVSSYYEKDDKDPAEWLEVFDQAATANQ